MAIPIESPGLPDRAGALLGVLGVAGNVLGVVFLADVPMAYRPNDLDGWARLSLAHPTATVASAAAFVLGLLALAGWAAALGRATGSRVGLLAGSAIAAGALVNAAGCVAPLVLVAHVGPACAGAECGPAARALLGTTLSLDALFNLILGLGLVALSAALWKPGGRALAALSLAAGLASVPVSGQAFSETASRLLGVAAPLWLAFVLWSSARIWRGTWGRP